MRTTRTTRTTRLWTSCVALVPMVACAGAVPPAAEPSAPPAVEPTVPPAAESTPPVLDARFGGERRHQELAELAAQMQVPEGENIVVQELSRDGDTSHHLVGVRDREPLHRHDRSALTVVVLRGQGEMLIEGETLPVAAGSVLYVPRRTVHAFINGGAEPAVAYVVFSPPFDPRDRVPADAPLPPLEAQQAAAAAAAAATGTPRPEGVP